jgi:hypothetical protein
VEVNVEVKMNLPHVNVVAVVPPAHVNEPLRRF